MSGSLHEFFADIEEEFDVGLPARGRAVFRTPGDVIDFLTEETAPVDGMTPEEHRDHVAAIVGELMARGLGVTRYREDSRFVEDLNTR